MDLVYLEALLSSVAPAAAQGHVINAYPDLNTPETGLATLRSQPAL